MVSMLCDCCVVLCAVRFGLMLFQCVFFFKQKTAYELRISDWSSDVCSSDLLQVGIVQRPFGGLAFADVERNGQNAGGSPFGVLQRNLAFDCGVEIGRARCRERVCQYV